MNDFWKRCGIGLTILLLGLGAAAHNASSETTVVEEPPKTCSPDLQKRLESLRGSLQNMKDLRGFLSILYGLFPRCLPKDVEEQIKRKAELVDRWLQDVAGYLDNAEAALQKGDCDKAAFWLDLAEALLKSIEKLLFEIIELVKSASCPAPQPEAP